MTGIIASERGLSSTVVILFVILLIFGTLFAAAGFSPFTQDGTDSTGQTATPEISRTESGSDGTTISKKIPATVTSSQPTSTDTPIETLNPSSTQTLSSQTPTPTSTPTPTTTEPASQYYEFAIEFFGQLNVRSPVAVRLRGVEIRDGVMWVVVNSTSPSINRSKLRSERNSVANMYARAYQVHEEGNIDGQRPNKLRYIEANTTSNRSPKTYTVNNSLVHQYVYGDRSVVWYNDNWRQTLRDATAREKDIAISIDRGAENNTVGPEAGS